MSFLKQHALLVILSFVVLASGAAVLYLEWTKPSVELPNSGEVKLGQRPTDSPPPSDSISRYKASERN